MKIETLAGGFDKNFTYVVACERSGKGFVVDASATTAEILEAAARLDTTLELLLLTHSHADHVTYAQDLLEQVDGMRLAAFGTEAGQLAPPDRFDELSDGQTCRLGELSFDIFHTPGHYPDSVCIRCGDALFSGDTLFIGRTGRTIGARSDARQLYQSIRDKLLPLDDGLTIYPGHDYGPTPTDTLGAQRECNAFLQATSEEDFLRIMDE